MPGPARESIWSMASIAIALSLPPAGEAVESTAHPSEVPSIPGKYALMDHGPFYTGTVVQPQDRCTNKGIVIFLDQAHHALAVFDPELMRFAFAATSASLIYPTGRDGIEGQPRVAGDVIMAGDEGTGWARPGSDDFADPRSRERSDQRLGNLPKDWAAYKGLYLHGSTVVLSYRVGSADVLEVPGLEEHDGVVAFTRSLTLAGNDRPLTVLVAERKGGQAATEGGLGSLGNAGDLLAAAVTGGGRLIADGQRLVLRIPAGTTSVKIMLCHRGRTEIAAFGSLRAASAAPFDAHLLTTGGPGRWGPALNLVGQRGMDQGPYAVDTITVPYENPSKSYMRLSGLDFFADGRAAVCTLDGDVWIVSGIDAQLADVSWRRFATGLFQPMGIRIVEGLVYVLCRDRIIRLHDLDGDGEADFYENFNGDCPVTRFYHEFAMDLATDREGNFYYNKGSNLGEAVDFAQGCVLKVSRDGTH